MRMIGIQGDYLFCPNCGKQIPDDAKFCPECGFASSKTEATGPKPVDANTAIMFNKKSEGLALILSLLICGLGQIYVGKATRGIGFLLGAIVLAVLSAFLFFPIIVAFVLWVYGMYDAYNLARQYNEYLLSHNGQTPW